MISALTEEELTRCFYKNQLISLIRNNQYFKEKTKELLKYKYTDKIEDGMVPLLNEYREKIIDFCFYDYLFEDRYKRAMQDNRNSIIAIDTDLVGSFIISKKL